MKAFTILMIFTACTAFSQQIQFHPGETTICHGSERIEKSSIPYPGRKGRIKNESTAVINVVYNGFTEEAQTAFQYAVDIWAGTISTEVPIRITANWSQLGAGVLGSASSTSTVSNFENAPLANVRYPLALAEKLARKQLNLEAQSEISANFNSEINWYYGTDANPATDQYDMVSVVLHEIGHGLGFSASFGANAQVAAWGLSSTGQTNTPIIYDLYLQDRLGNKLIDESVYPNNSGELLAAVSSNDVLYGSPIARSEYGQFPPIFAPNPWNGGSSISHLDESVFPAGDPNSLMSPQFGLGEAIHLPGEVTEAIFAELGWVHSFLAHDEIKFIENPDAPVLFSMTVDSDSVVKSENLTLFISENDFSNSSAYGLHPAAGSYETLIPYEELPSQGSYFFRYRSPEGRFYYSPPDSSISPFTFTKDLDVEPPVVTHLQEGFISSEDFRIIFDASDNFGLARIFISYKVNADGQITTEDYGPEGDDGTYAFEFNKQELDLKADDTLYYQINVIDKSINANTTTFPKDDFIKRPVFSFAQALDFYAINFDSEGSGDSVGLNNLTIEIPSGFTSSGIHSSHPYSNGTSGFASLILKHPVLLKANSIISFDAIVLTEPSEELSQNDFLIVEASSDGGENWIAIDEKVDAGSEDVWLTRYDSEFGQQGSTASADQSLFRNSTIPLISPTLPFRINEEIVFRISFIANELNNAWGFTIDNIKVGVVPITNILDQSDLRVYPNPALNYLVLSTQVNATEVSLRDLSGRLVKIYNSFNGNRIDISDLTQGAYILTISRINDQMPQTFKIIKR